MSTTIYTSTEAAAATGISYQAVSDLAHAHAIGLRTVGGKLLFRPRDLARLKALYGTRVGRPRKSIGPEGTRTPDPSP